MNPSMKKFLWFVGGAGLLSWLLWPKDAGAVEVTIGEPTVITPELPPAPPVEMKLYTVIAGETLSGIAAKLFGDYRWWTRIFDLNAAAIGPNPDAISAGLMLRVPADMNGVDATPYFQRAEIHRQWWASGHKGSMPAAVTRAS